jgi:hypothetical protein
VALLLAMAYALIGKARRLESDPLRARELREHPLFL